MFYNVEYSDKALDDIESILAWFAEQGAKAAGARWLNLLYAKTDTLEQHPQRCPIVAEFAKSKLEIRKILLGKRNNKYRVVFRLEQDNVLVLRIWHAARDRLKFEDL